MKCKKVSEILEAHEVQEVPKLLEAHEPGGIGKLSIGSSSSNEVKTCQVEVIVGGLSFSYCVPSSWRLCQGKEYAGFEVDEVPNTEILESVKSQYPGIEVCWEIGVVQLRRSWVRHQVELRGVSVELTVPCSWKLIQSSEYKCAFFAVEEKPGEDLLIQVLRQQQEELEGLEINFLDGIVIVRMPSGGDSDRASYFQKQFECYLARRGMAGKWLFGNSNTLYSYSNYGRRFCPDFTVIDDSLATQARMEQQEQGDTSPVYKDVRLLLAIDLQSQTDRMQDVKVKAREMISICADVVICFCAYNDGEVWTFSSGQSDSIVKQPRFLTLDSVAEDLRLYTSCLPSKSWPFNNQQPEMRLMKVSELLETARLAIEHGDGALVEEAINYLDDLNVEYGGLSLLASAATVESVECTQYILTNGALPTVDDDLCDC